MKIKSATFALLVTLIPSTWARHAPFMQVDLFHQGEDGVSTYRIPALVETANGVLIAVADARHDSPKDLPARISLVMRRSFTNGDSWEASRTIQEVKRGGVGDAALLLDRSNHRVWCFFTYGPAGIGFWNAQPGAVTGPTTLQIHAIHSDDDGATWSEPVDLTPALKKPAWRAMFAASGTDVQTSTGRLLVPLVVRDAQGIRHSANAYSDDHGETWKTGDLIGESTDESHNVELKDGSILQNMRYGPTRAIAISQNGGVTFGPVTNDAALIDPVCNAGITHDRFGSRDVLVFTNDASTRRENLTVRFSYDGGRTWPVARLINSGPSAYSTVIRLRDGSIAVLYERGKQRPYEQIVFARFKPEWVMESH